MSFKMINFCDKRFVIGFIAIIDMIYGAVLFSLYLRKLMFFYVSDGPTTEEFSPPSLRLLILFPLSLNGFQVLIAYHLLMSTRKVDPFRSLAKATMWFQTAIVILTFLGFKLLLIVMFSFTSNSDSDNLPVTLLMSEILFKIVSIYIVKEFLDDLKYLAYPPPSVHFYSVYVPSTSPTPSYTLDTTTARSVSPTGNSNNNNNPNALNFPNYMNRPGSGSVSPTPVFV